MYNMEISPKPETALYVNRTAITEEWARGIAENAKLAMFSIPPKKPLFGPKPGPSQNNKRKQKL